MLGLNGVRLPVELADAEDMAEALVAMKRAIPYKVWSLDPVDVQLAELDKLF